MRRSFTEIVITVFVGLFAVIGAYGWMHPEPRASRAQLEADRQRWAVAAASQALQPGRRKPEIACAYLKVFDGLQTRGWKSYTGVDWTCLSYPVKVAANSLSNIAYHVNGTQTEARELKLVLNLYYGEDAAAAQELFASYAAALYKNALGQAIIAEINDAMMAGRTGKWNANFASAVVELTEGRWPTGKGYTYNLLIK